MHVIINVSNYTDFSESIKYSKIERATNKPVKGYLFL